MEKRTKYLEINSQSCSLCSMFIITVLLWFTVLSPLPWNFNALPMSLYRTQCVETKPEVLLKVLGPGYNRRYMSAERPHDFHSKVSGMKSLRMLDRDSEDKEMLSDQQSSRPGPQKKLGGPTDASSFYVDADFERPLAGNDVPALLHTTHNSASTKNIQKRQAPQTYAASPTRKYPTQEPLDPFEAAKLWGCNATIIWVDLGEDYFPRYIHGVECSKSPCWFGFFSCKPRAFTINVLKRKSNSCLEDDEGNEVSPVTRTISRLVGVSEELTEKWQFVEVAVTFCCECVQNMVHEN